MSKPKRIQRKRTKGWRMPEGAVYVGRPTKWGNPYLSPPMGVLASVELFRKFVDGNRWTEPNIHSIKRELRGKDLVCWCLLGQPCHADVLLEIANSGGES